MMMMGRFPMLFGACLMLAACGSSNAGDRIAAGAFTGAVIGFPFGGPVGAGLGAAAGAAAGSLVPEGAVRFSDGEAEQSEHARASMPAPGASGAASINR